MGSDGSPGTWTDRGTGFVTGTYSEELGTAAIVAKSEMNDVELLRSEIRISHGYQRQQGEGSEGDECEMAFLSHRSALTYCAWEHRHTHCLDRA